MSNIMSITLGVLVTSCAILCLAIAFGFLSHVVADMAGLPVVLVMIVALLLALAFMIS